MLKRLLQELGIMDNVTEYIGEAELTASVLAEVEEVAQASQTRLNNVTPKLLKLNKRLLTLLLANSTFPRDYTPEAIIKILGELATKSEQLIALLTQVSAAKGKINPNLKAEYNSILLEQQSAEADFMSIHDEMLETIGAMNDVADEIDAKIKDTEKVGTLIHEAAVSKGLWDTLLANKFLPDTVNKDRILAKIKKLDADLDSLLEGNTETNYEDVRAAFDANIKVRVEVEGLVSKAQADADKIKTLLVSSPQGIQAINGAGSLAKRTASNDSLDKHEPATDTNKHPGLYGQ